MAKTYSMRFGSGDPRTLTGLSPTFLIFSQAGTPVTPPSITEAPAASGLYIFTWGTSTPIQFLADAATTSPGPTGRYVTGQLDPSDRIDEVGTTLIAFGVTNVALGTTNVALGTTSVALGTTAVALGNTAVALGSTSVAIGTTVIAISTTLVAIGTSLLAQGETINSYLGSIGSTASSFGDNTQDPVDLFGYLKRIQENLEGNQQFVKMSGLWNISSRGGSVLLSTKTITNSVSTVIRT